MGVLALAACLLANGTVAGSASTVPGTLEHRCKVGGSPAWRFPRVVPGVKQLSPAVTVACGRRLVGPYEIVALDTSEGLWVYADSGALGFSEGQSIRNPDFPDFLERAITVSSGWGAPPARSHVFGALAGDVARVEVVFHHKGRRRRLVREPTMAHVSGELLSVLRQTDPFGAYAITLPGCVPPKGIRVFAFDAQGRRIGTARPPSFLPHPCNPKTWFSRH